MMMGFFLAAWASAAGAVEYSTAASVERSSATRVERSAAARTPETPFRVQFLYDHRRGASAEVGYFLRWDGQDVKKIPGGTLRVLRNPFGSAERVARELFSSADVGVYSMRFRLGRYLPLDTLLAPLSMASDAVEAGFSNGNGEASPPRGRKRRRLRPELTPVIADIEKNVQREIRRGLIQTGFDYAVPAGRNATFAQKEAVVESLRQARDSWEDMIRARSMEQDRP